MESTLETLAVLCLLPTGLVGLLFWHELGHALPVLAAGGRARITIGSDDGRTVEVGRLSVTAGLSGFGSLFRYGRIHWFDIDSTTVQALSIAGGPVASLTAIAVLGFLLLGGVGGLLFWMLANLLVSETIRAYQTIRPKTYSRGGVQRDGQRRKAIAQAASVRPSQR